MFLTYKILNKTKFHSNKEALKTPLIHFFSLFDADLLLIWMNNFRHGFRFRRVSCPVLHIVLIISRGECSTLNIEHSILYSSRRCSQIDVKICKEPQFMEISKIG